MLLEITNLIFVTNSTHTYTLCLSLELHMSSYSTMLHCMLHCRCEYMTVVGVDRWYRTKVSYSLPVYFPSYILQTSVTLVNNLCT